MFEREGGRGRLLNISRDIHAMYIDICLRFATRAYVYACVCVCVCERFTRRGALTITSSEHGRKEGGERTTLPSNASSRVPLGLERLVLPRRYLPRKCPINSDLSPVPLILSLSFVCPSIGCAITRMPFNATRCRRYANVDALSGRAAQSLAVAPMTSLARTKTQKNPLAR